jgi:hypothetical protein
MSDGRTLIPSLPSTRMLVDANGKMTDDWYDFFSTLTNVLQNTLSLEGILLPPQAATEITRLDNNGKSQRRVLFDSTNNVAKVNLTGTFKTIQTA